MRGKLELSPRLRGLAEWVPEGVSFADIGTDHAFLPVWLVLHGRVRACVASDLRREPLRRARETARQYGADMRFRLCDGLTGLAPEEAEVVCIAGLGGEKIAAILQKAPWTADGRHTLLLQPMTRADVLRRFLAEHGYCIRRETVVRERETLYALMEAGAGEMSLTPGQLQGGAALLHDPLGDRYLIEQILRLQSAAAGLNRAIRLEERRAAPTDPRRAQARRDKIRANREKADRLRGLVTELLSMREDWRRANGRHPAR